MGITGLLPLLKSVQKPIYLSELSGKTLAVDAYVWLHRGVCCCATELATGKPTTKYVEYAMQRVRLLQHYNITPYLVFDGGPLPAKEDTELRRQRRRKESLETAKALADQGKHSLAREHYLKAVDVTPQMAFQLIKALRAHSIPYIVAPYEADAQLYYLESIGVVNGILTEDSDLLIFGAKSLYLKMDTTNSSCILIQSETLASNSNPDFPLHGWGLKELRECAMLNGCDYLDGIPGVGLKTASRYLRRWRTMEKALRALRMDGKVVQKDWETKMRIAEVGFLHQRVWDPLKNQIVYLTEPNVETWNADQEYFAGRYIEPDLALRISRGDVDPTTLRSMVDILPSYQPSQSQRSRPLASINLNRPRNPTVETKGSILQYFHRQTDATKHPANLSHSPSSQNSLTGKASGKRTLVEEYGREASVKRRKSISLQFAQCNQRSKFFMGLLDSAEREIQIRDDDKGQSKKCQVKSDEEVHSMSNTFEAFTNFPDPKPTGSTFPTPIRGTDTKSRIETGRTPDLSSPVHRFAVSNCSTPRSKDLQKTVTDDIRDNEPSPNSSDGRITSPPPIPVALNSIRTGQGPKTVTEDADVFAVDLRDTFSSKGVVTTDWIKSPFPSQGYKYTDDIIDGEFEERQRLVMEGWGKKFLNKAYVKRTPTQPNGTKTRNPSFDTVIDINRKLRVDAFERKPLILDDPIKRLQIYRFE